MSRINTLDGRCKNCGHVFTVANLPMPMDQVAKLAMKAKCPECGCKRIAVATPLPPPGKGRSGMGEVADRYITPGGRTDDYGRRAVTDDLIDAASFLVWAEHDREMFGGVHAADAYRAFCRLMDIDGVALRNIVMGRDPLPTNDNGRG